MRLAYVNEMHSVCNYAPYVAELLQGLQMNTVDSG